MMKKTYANSSEDDDNSNCFIIISSPSNDAIYNDDDINVDDANDNQDDVRANILHKFHPNNVVGDDDDQTITSCISSIINFNSDKITFNSNNLHIIFIQCNGNIYYTSFSASQLQRIDYLNIQDNLSKEV